MTSPVARRRVARFAYSKYESVVERVTATIDGETLTAIREIAGPRGVSAFLQAAARERVARLRVLGLLDELDARFGKPSKAVEQAVAKQARRLFRQNR
jgi:hypothetical protein